MRIDVEGRFVVRPQRFVRRLDHFLRFFANHFTGIFRLHRFLFLHYGRFNGNFSQWRTFAFSTDWGLNFRYRRIFFYLIPLYLGILRVVLTFHVLFFVTFYGSLLFKSAPRLKRGLTSDFVGSLVRGISNVSHLPNTINLLTRLSMANVTGARHVIWQAVYRFSPFATTNRFRLYATISTMDITNGRQLPVSIREGTVFNFHD